MNSIIFLIVICSIYYYIYRSHNEYLESKYHYYFGGFVSLYLIVLYLYYFEYQFFYKVLKNIYDTSRQPLYSFNAKDSNAELYNSLNPNQDIKPMLAQKQGQRCAQCQNYIMGKDINYYKLNIIIWIHL